MRLTVSTTSIYNQQRPKTDKVNDKHLCTPRVVTLELVLP